MILVSNKDECVDGKVILLDKKTDIVNKDI